MKEAKRECGKRRKFGKRKKKKQEKQRKKGEEYDGLPGAATHTRQRTSRVERAEGGREWEKMRGVER